MRFRTIQAGPLMQMPVFMVLFFAPVYVPLALLEGWIEVNAKLNPLTYVLEAERSMLAGAGVHVALAFGLTTALVLSFSLWALRGLRSAEAAG
jgi:ABC-2 type transport system permease protein